MSFSYLILITEKSDKQAKQFHKRYQHITKEIQEVRVSNKTNERERGAFCFGWKDTEEAISCFSI